MPGWPRSLSPRPACTAASRCMRLPICGRKRRVFRRRPERLTRMIKHIVMWNVGGSSPEEKSRNIARLREGFESLRGRIPGLLRLEVGVDSSRIDYACDVVLYSEFESQAALDAYGQHPEHLRLRDELAGLRVARHQVDYQVA